MCPKWLDGFFGALFICTWNCGNRVCKHFLMFLNYLCLIACLLCCLLMSYFFGVVLWLGICVEAGCRQNYYLTPPPSPLYFLPTHYSLFNTSDSYQFEISGRLKLVSVPLSILVYILV